jgi:hypothetical protein
MPWYGVYLDESRVCVCVCVCVCVSLLYVVCVCVLYVVCVCVCVLYVVCCVCRSLVKSATLGSNLREKNIVHTYIRRS